MTDIAQDIKKAINEKLESSQEDSRRLHLGASLIGGLCDREIWFAWRWAKKLKHSGRMLRLFNRGHLEELRFEEWINSISDKFWAVHPDTGEQIRVSDFKGYFGGSLDGVVRNPAGYKGDYLTEFKTHSVKSFEKLVVKKVKEAKPEHYTQMQIYLHYNPKLKGALYFAIQKNDDELYIEYVERDAEWAKKYLDRAKKILLSYDPPSQHDSASEFNFYCKYFCDFNSLCFNNDKPDKSCRTCAYVETKDIGWYCSKDKDYLDSHKQKEGCDNYERLF